MLSEEPLWVKEESRTTWSLLRDYRETWKKGQKARNRGQISQRHNKADGFGVESPKGPEQVSTQLAATPAPGVPAGGTGQLCALVILSLPLGPGLGLQAEAGWPAI